VWQEGGHFVLKAVHQLRGLEAALAAAAAVTEYGTCQFEANKGRSKQALF
jgi:hypothetical protein